MPQDPSEKMFSIIYHEHYIHTKGILRLNLEK